MSSRDRPLVLVSKEFLKKRLVFVIRFSGRKRECLADDSWHRERDPMISNLSVFFMRCFSRENLRVAISACALRQSSALRDFLGTSRAKSRDWHAQDFFRRILAPVLSSRPCHGREAHAVALRIAARSRRSTLTVPMAATVSALRVVAPVARVAARKATAARTALVAKVISRGSADRLPSPSPETRVTEPARDPRARATRAFPSLKAGVHREARARARRRAALRPSPRARD